MKRTFPTVVASAVTSAALLAPRVAEACPSCAGNDKGGVIVGIMIGALILLPYPIVALVIRVIRKHEAS